MLRFGSNMVKVDIQFRGREALQRKLEERKQALVAGLTDELSQLGEASVTYSKDNKGYRDRTANLKNSISYELFLDGELITTYIGQIPKPDAIKDGQHVVKTIIDAYADKPGIVAPRGFTLIVVAGMEYARYVEDKGYNVLYLTKEYLRNELKKILQRIVERINNGKS